MKKNKWVSDHSVEIIWIIYVQGYFMSCRIFHDLQDDWNIPTKINEHMITVHLFLFICRTTIDWILISKIYLYNIKSEFWGLHHCVRWQRWVKITHSDEQSNFHKSSLKCFEMYAKWTIVNNTFTSIKVKFYFENNQANQGTY